MRFDFIDLRLFAAIADAGTITGGARRVHITLASASERVRSMEQSLAVPLLLRRRSGVEPTPAGTALLRHARLILQQVDLMRDELGALGQGFRETIRMQCNTAALSEELPLLLADFLGRHPHLSIDLAEKPSMEIADALRSGTIDLGVLADHADLAGLVTYPLRDDRLVLIVGARHAMAKRERIRFADLPQDGHIGLREDSALQRYIQKQATSAGRQLLYRLRLDGLEAVCRAVAKGAGMAIVPQAAAVRHGAAMTLTQVALTDPWASRELRLCVSVHANIAGRTQALIQALVGPSEIKART